MSDGEAYWLLDVTPGRKGAVLHLYDEKTGEIVEKEYYLSYRGYVTGEDPRLVARDLEGIDGVESVMLEKWRKPPYYTSQVDLVVFETADLGLLSKLVREGFSKGLKFVNTYPHPLIEALWRRRLMPLTRVAVRDGGVEPLPWQPEHPDPVLDYVVIGISDGYYYASTREGTQIFWDAADLVEYLELKRFHVGFADEEVFAKLLAEGLRPGKCAHRWVVGGSFHPAEYFEWSRLSYMPLSLLNGVTIGKILTTIEALVARERKMIVDKQAARPEKWRRLRSLLLYDRGGVIYQPKPGIYWHVCQIDFKSMYPSIIVKYNISGETVNRDLCDKPVRHPWAPHEVCLDERGVVPESIEKLLELKEIYSALSKRGELYEARKSAVKWILVASFGYLGYRNSLFGSVAAHEMVTSTSRELMTRAKVAVEKKGFRVVHALVDSLFISGVEEMCLCEELKKIIEQATGLSAKVEAHYVWLYIPRNISGARGVSNRYFGLLADGSWKIKGLMCVRRDTPALVKMAQLEALSKLFEARDSEEMASKIREAREVLERYVQLLLEEKIDPRLLVLTRRGRSRGEYVKPPLYVNTQGESPPYRLIYVNGRLKPFEGWEKRFDAAKYVELLEKAFLELPSLSDITPP